MGATTGPILAAGGITAFNRLVLVGTGNSPIPGTLAPADYEILVRVGVATAIAGVGFSLWEAATPRTATAVAWLALLTVLLVRIENDVPAPLETLSNWYKTGSGK